VQFISGGQGSVQAPVTGEYAAADHEIDRH
jgi:hypothetical protein